MSNMLRMILLHGWGPASRHRPQRRRRCQRLHHSSGRPCHSQHSLSPAAAQHAFSTKRTRRPKRAAATRGPAGPRNAFELLEDDVSDTERGAAADAGGSSGGVDCPQEAAGLHSADFGSMTPTVRAAAAAAPATAGAAGGCAGSGAAAAAAAAALSPSHPRSSSGCSEASRQPERQQAPSQPEPPPPAAVPPPQPQAPVPAAQLPVTVPAAMLGDDCVGNFECPLTLDVMEDPVSNASRLAHP